MVRINASCNKKILVFLKLRGVTEFDRPFIAYPVVVVDVVVITGRKKKVKG